MAVTWRRYVVAAAVMLALGSWLWILPDLNNPDAETAKSFADSASVFGHIAPRPRSKRNPAQDSAYTEFFDSVMDSFAVTRVGACLYEKGVFDAAADEEAAIVRATKSGAKIPPRTLLQKESLVWSLKTKNRPPQPPRTFRSFKDQLRQTKILISIALDRLRQDPALQREHAGMLAALKDDTITAELRGTLQSTLNTFERSVGNMAAAIVSFGYTVVQTAIDIRNPGRERGAAVNEAEAELCGLRILEPIEGERKRRPAPLPWLQQRAALLRLNPDSLPFDQQGLPETGRFWNLFRPALGCTSVVKQCEVTDGCRFVCNFDYLLFRKEPTRNPELGALAATARAASGLRNETNTGMAPVPIDAVGFGCNNQFDWEDSLIGSHDEATTVATRAGRPDSVNPLRAIATFDCTVNPVRPTAVVRGMAGGYGFGKICLDGVPSATAMTMGQLPSVLRHGRRTTRGIDGQAIATEMVWFGQQGKPSKPAFQHLSMLKIDVEGYEFFAFPQWLRDELASHANGQPRIVADQFQLEFHRLGWDSSSGASISSTLRALLLFLEMYALGFVPVATERNHAGDCCYEFVFVSSSFYPLSEAWVVALDRKGL